LDGSDDEGTNRVEDEEDEVAVDDKKKVDMKKASFNKHSKAKKVEEKKQNDEGTKREEEDEEDEVAVNDKKKVDNKKGSVDKHSELAKGQGNYGVKRKYKESDDIQEGCPTLKKNKVKNFIWNPFGQTKNFLTSLFKK